MTRRLRGRGVVRSLLGVCAAVLMLGFSPASWAMLCKSMDGGTYLNEYIGPVSVPDTVPDGTIIWRSKTHVVPAKCWKLFDQHFNEDDPIYFYGNPAGLDATPWGIEFGLVYKQVTAWDGDWSSNPTQGVNTGFISRGCPTATSGADMLACSTVNPTIAFQVVIRKRGLLPLQRPSQDTYDVFQFDGLYGLNGGPSNPAGNFRFQLSGLQNIVGTACTVDVKVTPEPGIVDFGVIQKTSTGLEPPSPTQPFNLALEKKCSSAINIGATFVTPYQQGQNTLLPAADSQLGIQVRDARNTLVPINEPFPLASFPADVSHIDVPFSATVVSLGDPKVGPFEAIMVVQVVYY
ncbi:fimbrial protein [Pseudomonas sp. GM25]|uniref:fimbrial protein n=1 Tax=Pseudomonas sp. GM25 TaxID=1144327 RepID=UPI00026FE33C|nr:fimbrial protein [Pseudomonas sp. GM25]EJM27398.1 Fimbrial protein [Pseudomonas sp. GM25]